jgi:hypothetical protein
LRLLSKFINSSIFSSSDDISFSTIDIFVLKIAFEKSAVKVTKNVVPKSIIRIPKILPAVVIGVTFPYQTVVTVEKENQSASI